MNLREFAALKAGDKISNAMGNSQGEVVAVMDAGVKVRWGEAAPGRADLTFTYVVNGTSWFHWSKVEPRECTAGPCYREDCRKSDQCLGGDYDKIAAGCTT